MTARLIPERTVDSLLAYEALTALPTAIIWSPSNTAGSWDHAVTTGSRLLIFECKGVVSNAARDPNANWTIPIDRVQLDAYVRLSVPVTYLLLTLPRLPGYPWIRACLDDPIDLIYGACGACYAPAMPGTRAGAGHHPHLGRAPRHVRLQPWFSHWAWCITASDLRAAYPTRNTIKATNETLETVTGAERLCHVLASLRGSLPAATSENYVISQPLIREIAGTLSNLWPTREDSLDDEDTPPVAIGL